MQACGSIKAGSIEAPREDSQHASARQGPAREPRVTILSHRTAIDLLREEILALLLQGGLFLS